MDRDWERLERARRELVGKSEEEMAQLANNGRFRIWEYVREGKVDLDTIARIVDLSDDSSPDDPASRRIIMDAHAAARSLSHNFGNMAEVLAPLAKLAAQRQADEN